MSCQPFGVRKDVIDFPGHDDHYGIVTDALDKQDQNFMELITRMACSRVCSGAQWLAPAKLNRLCR